MSIDSKFDSEDIRIAPRRYSLGTRVAAALSTAMLAATLMFSGCKDPRDLDKGDNSYQHDLPTMNVPVDPARVYGTGADAGADGDADADSDSLRITPTMNLPVDAGRADAETAYDSNADAGRDADSEPLPGGLTDTRVSDIPLSAPAEPETEAEETYDPNHGMDEDVYADFQDLFAEDYSLLVPDPEQYADSSSTAASGTDDDLTLTAAENFTEDTAATTEPSATADDAVSGTATGPTATADPDTAPAPTAATSSPAADTGCNADLYSRIVAAVRAVNPVSHNPSYNLEGEAISNQDVVNTAYSHSIEGRTVRPYEGNWRGAQRWLDSITGGLVKIWDLTGSRDGENRRGYEFTLSTLPGCADDTPAEDAGTPAPTAPRRTSGGTGGHGHGGHSHGSHGGGSHAHAPSHPHAPSHAPAHAGPPNMETAPDGHTIITTPSGGIVHYGTYGESTIPDLTPGMHEAGTIGVLPDGSTVDLGATAALPAREEQPPAVEESAPAVEDAAPAAVPDAAPELVPETAPTAPEVIPDLVPPTPASDDN
ncbi:hypothetical protein KY359_04225, partial [Candidatus Woesearchaeota archaeon]|nr:hypothetical protein [Candidatus Woesearchaeota archaeon]